MPKGTSRIEDDLESEIERIPMLSTHSHFAGSALYQNADEFMEAVSLFKHLSGRWQPMVHKEINNLPLTKRSEEETHQHVFRIRMLVQTLQRLFGYEGERLTKKGVDKILSKLNAIRGPDEAKAVSRALDLANIDIQVVDSIDTNRCFERLRTARRIANILSWEEAAASGKSLSEYLSIFADKMREWKKSESIVALKFPFAYSRTLSISDPPESHVKRIYKRDPSTLEHFDHRLMEDFLIRHSLRQCAEIDFPVQIHTGFGWANGKPLHIDDANVMNLVPLFESPEFRNVRFLIFHGSWPFTAEMGYLAASYENVFLDFNCMVALSRDMLGRTLSEWLDIVPLHKIMTGTDGPYLEWWISTAHETRKVLAKVLSQKVINGLYSEDMAVEAARAILNLNAQEALDISLRPVRFMERK